MCHLLSSYSVQQRVWHILLLVMRWLVGGVFIFSGLVKSFDPVGTSIFVEKYLAVYGLDVLMPAALAIAVALAVVETMLGLLLVGGVAKRYTALVTTLLLALFTIITLLSATILPIGDCGCFGDAVKLTPWQTFFKNVILLPLTILVWRRSPKHHGRCYIGLLALLFAVAVPLALNLYALRHLPIIDFMPYKRGTNLLAAVAKERDEEANATRSILIFNNMESGQREEYPATDVECWTNPNLQYVDARTITTKPAAATYHDFRIYDSAGNDVTLDLLSLPNRVAWLCISDSSALSGERLAGIQRLLDRYPSHSIILVTSADDCTSFASRYGLNLYHVDAMTLRSMLRAKVGVVLLNDGIIEYKADIRDI